MSDLTVFLEETSYGGAHIYNVMVDYRLFDCFVSSTRLTWSQMDDVAAGYREALDDYTAPSVESVS